MKDQQGNNDQKVIRAILVQKRDKGDRNLKRKWWCTGAKGDEVTKEILVHKGHLVVVVLGLRVLKLTMDKDQKEILVLRVQKVTKETPVLKVPMVIKGTLEHRDLNLIKVIEGHRGHLVVVILQTFQLFHNRMELR